MVLILVIYVLAIYGSLVNGDGTKEPYYGVRIGSLSESEVYASDTKTLTIIGEKKTLEEAECITYIGSLLDTSESDAASAAVPQRVKRQGMAVKDGNLVPQIQALNPNRHPLDWPFEFGHLKVEDDGSESSSANGASVAKKSQDPFDVELSKNDEDDMQNSTRPSATITPDPETAVTVVGTHPTVSRVRTVSAAISDIDELPTSIAGPRLTLPHGTKSSTAKPRTTTASSTAKTTHAVPSSSVPTVVLSSVVLSSSVETGEANETDADVSLASAPPASILGTTPPVEPEASTHEPPAIRTIEDESASEEVTEDATAPPTTRKALWSRPTTEPSNASEEADPFADAPEENENSTSAAATATSSIGTSQKPKGRKDRTKTTSEAKPKSTKQPSNPNSDSDHSKSERNRAQVQGRRPADPAVSPSASSNPGSQSSGGIVWLGQNAPSTASPEAGVRGNSGSAQLPPGKQGRNSSNRPVSVLRQLPVEYFGGLNVPDEVEGKQNRTGETAKSANREAQAPGVIAGDEGYTIKFGGRTRGLTVSPPQQPLPPSPQQQQAGQQSFRGLPPSPPAAPAAQAPGTQSIEQTRPAPEIVAVKNYTYDMADTPSNDTDCAGKLWCVIADPHRRRTRPPSTTPPPSASQGDGRLYHVVDDRYAQLRDSVALQARNKRQVASKISAKKPYQKVRKNPASLIQPLALKNKSGNQIYLLPRFDGKRTTVRLPEAYQLNDFESIGVFDQCRKVRVGTIKTKNIQAPKEAQIPGFRGLQFGVSCSQARVLNCNSILLKNFTFNGTEKTEAFFYVGAGAYPFSVTAKTRALVVGEDANNALKNYIYQDILVRLPAGLRTMDITWLAMLSPKGTSIAHVIIPPVAVPPCD